MTGRLLFVAYTSLALIAAWTLARTLLPNISRLERALATLSAFPVIVLPTATLLGALGWLGRGPVTSALALEAVALALWAKRLVLPGPATSNSEIAARPPTRMRLVECALVGLAVAVASSCFLPLLLNGWKPTTDDVDYHAPMAAHWLQSAKLVLAPPSYHAYYPGNGELFAAFFMLATRLDAYASLSGIYWLVLCAVALAQACRRIEADIAPAALSVAAIFISKTFAEQARTFAAVDLACAALSMAATALVLGMNEHTARAEARSRVVLSSALFGLAIGTKVTSAPMAAAVIAWAIWQHRPERSELLELCSLSGVATMICGTYFYVRNVLVTGNPLFPANFLWFEGPLRRSVLSESSLVNQLRKLHGAELSHAWGSLLDWPVSLAWLLIAAYAAAAVLAAMRVPSRDVARSIALLVLVGALALLVAANGPFSGATYGAHPHFLPRKRFFLVTPACGLVLLAYVITHVQRARVLAVALLGGWIAWQARDRVWLLAPAMTVGACVPLAVDLIPRQRLRQLGALSTCTMLVLIASAASVAASAKQQKNDAILHSNYRKWSILDRARSGSRVAWFTNRGVAYYPVFGSGLRRVPVKVESDGRPIELLHERWRTYKNTWDTQRSQPGDPQHLVDHLLAQRIDYVVVLRERREEWPPQIDVLSSDIRVKMIARDGSGALFKLGMHRAHPTSSRAASK